MKKAKKRLAQFDQLNQTVNNKLVGGFSSAICKQTNEAMKVITNTNCPPHNGNCVGCGTPTGL